MANPEVNLDQGFRDSIGTIDEHGNRKFVFPKKPKGKYTNYRQLVSLFLLALFFSGPFVKIGGQPLLLFNVLERKFVILGKIFWPEDFFIFVLAMLIGVLFVTVFTVAFGRLFCGWVCPQTIFLEHIFRNIEYWIDGDRNQQLRLKRMPWNREKIFKRTLKNSIFFGISFSVANFFMMYLISWEKWWVIVNEGPVSNLSGFSTILIFSAVFFFVFAWFREQVCLIVCPYGRLQGVLLDRHSVVIAYDYIRGEIRSKFRKGEDREAAGKGDCIDCNQCVDVCPTGIDIRNGTQLECINCTACIDACDAIMDQINKPRGLIRYESEENIATKKSKIFTARVLGYTGVLIILMGLFGFMLTTRAEVEAIVLRMPGQLYQVQKEEGTYSNAYNFKLINKTSEEQSFSFKLLEPKGRLAVAGETPVRVEESELAEGAILIYLPKEELSGNRTEVVLGLFDGDRLVDKIETTFNGPMVKPKK